MASIRKRGKGWFAEVRTKGVTKRGTFATKGDASTWAAEMQSQILLSKDSTGIPNITFGQLLKRYADEVSITKNGERWERVRINMIQRDPIAEIKLKDFNETHVAEWRDRRLKSVSAASVRREWNLLSAACSIALKEWKWLSNHPMKHVRRPKAPEARDRRISEDEQNTILFVLGYGKDALLRTQTARVGAAFLFAIETAMRLSELLGLTWNKINFTNQVATLEQTKNGTRREVPLSTEAVRILRQLKNSVEGDNVFDIKSSVLDSLFRKAKKKAMIEDLHFHDTRHEAITRLAKKLEVLELARMVGHKNLNQLLTYYNATASELAKKLD